MDATTPARRRVSEIVPEMAAHAHAGETPPNVATALGQTDYPSIFCKSGTAASSSPIVGSSSFLIDASRLSVLVKAVICPMTYTLAGFPIAVMCSQGLSPPKNWRKSRRVSPRPSHACERPINHELAQNTLIDVCKALEIEAQLCGKCSPDCDRLVRSSRPHRAEPSVGRDLQAPAEGLSRWPNSPKL